MKFADSTLECKMFHGAIFDGLTVALAGAYLLLKEGSKKPT